MRFPSIRGKGLGVSFPHEFQVDLDAIPGPLVAVTGKNGAGKTTFLELLGGAMYRVCATRGSLADLATGRDSFLEVDVVNGARHRIKHVLDSVSGKGESVVSDAEGNPLVASGKMREFDAWALKHLPPREVFYASMFAAQKSSGFIGMKPSERKAVLLRVLGIEHLEALAEKAREHVRSAKTHASALDARIADERARWTAPELIAAEIAALVAAKPDLEGAITIAKAALDQATAAEQIARLARQDVDAHMARRSELVARLQIATTKTQDVERRLVNNQGVLQRADEIRSAVARTIEIDGRLAELATATSEAGKALAIAENEHAVVEGEIADLGKQAIGADTRASRARARLADKATVDAAIASIAGMRERLEVLLVDAGRLDTSLREGQDLVLNSATTRIDALRNGLGAIAADGKGDRDPSSIARTALSDDDTTAAKVVEAPGVIAADRARLATVKAEVATLQTRATAAERTAARATEIANAEAEATEAAAEAAALRARIETAKAALPGLADALTVARATIATIEAERAPLAAERLTLAPAAKLVEPLAQAEARLAELEPQLAVLREESAGLSTDLDALGDLPENVTLPDLAGPRARIDVAREAVNANQASIAVKESQLAVANATGARLAELDRDHRAALDEVADWTRLADDLGRDGIQALEIDAAGPELTALVNDLLHTCVGTRWTVSIQASRLSADGKKVLEGCEVSVLDTVKGREGEAETLSGGEGVIVGEAISLALSMLSCRRSGITGPTLVRDETGAALDPENATAYVAMLRRACELVGASRLFFVSHNAESQALADGRIAIEDGKVLVS